MTRPAGCIRVTVETRDNNLQKTTAHCPGVLPLYPRFLTCAATGASARWCCGDVGDRGRVRLQLRTTAA